jgi:uncharacterized protein
VSDVFLVFGLLVAVEGLVLALAPHRIEDALRLLAGLPVDTRRMIGLGALALGVLIVWLCRPS